MRKSRKILSYFMMIVMFLFLFSGVKITNVSANERFNTKNGYLEYRVEDNSEITITGYYGTDTKISIPNKIDGKSVISIKKWEFGRCNNLTSITIPNSVISIDKGPFWGCTSLTSINVDKNNNYFSDENGVLFNKDKSLLICYPNGRKEESYTILNSVTNIENFAFWGCSSLTNIIIPNSVTSIGHSAFFACSGLTNITIPNSITSIGYNAFGSCGSLRNINVDKNNNYFSDESGILFNKNKSLLICYPNGEKKQSYIISNSVTSIGSGAFYSSNLASITIPNSVISIRSNAFEGCSNLTSITIPNSVTNIGAWAFKNCSSLTSITIPNSVVSINNYVFEGCNNLTIYGYKNSYAETYAKQYKIPFKVIGTEIDDDTNTQSTQLTMSPDKYTCDVDGVVDLTAGLVSSNITGEDVVWTSDNENIAIIEDTSYINSSDNSRILLHARVKGISEGTTNITVETKDGVKASATVNVEKKVVKPEVRDNRLKWSVDTFDFVNSEEDFGSKAGSNIFIGNFYKEALLEKLENMNNSTDKKVIEDRLKDGKWGGSCYGMSVVAILNKIGKIDISSIEGLKGAKNLNELEKPCINEDVKSLINFYHLQCSISEYTNRGVDFRKKTLKEQLKYIVDETEKVKEGGIPLIIDYAWVKDENKVKDDDTDIDNDEDTSGYGAHAVVAYDIEKDKEYEFDGVKYKYKVRVYDPNMLCDVSKNDIVKEGDKYCIYINEDFSKWIIPEAKGTISSNGKYTTYKLYNVDGIFDKLGEAIIQNVTNDLKVIDYVNFGEAIESHTAILKSEKEKKFKIKDRQKNVFFDIDGLNIKDSNEIYTFFAPNDLGTSSTLRIALANYDNEYMVEFDKNKKFDLSLQYDECYLKASSSSGNNVSFSPNGKVSLESDNSDFKLSVTVNETNLPWYTISASGANANEVSLEKIDEGVVLKGDNLKDVMVSGENDDETKEIKINTNKKEILIKNENNEMKAFVDTDNDGTFESKLDDTVQEKEIKLEKIIIFSTLAIISLVIIIGKKEKGKKE